MVCGASIRMDDIEVSRVSKLCLAFELNKGMAMKFPILVFFLTDSKTVYLKDKKPVSSALRFDL